MDELRGFDEYDGLLLIVLMKSYILLYFFFEQQWRNLYRPILGDTDFVILKL
jgi:hypothetical protein